MVLLIARRPSPLASLTGQTPDPPHGRAPYLTVILDLDVDVAAHSESPLNSQRQ